MNERNVDQKEETMNGPVIFNSTIFADLLATLMDGHITYKLGDKTKHLTAPEDIQSLDCSGLVEYVFYKITEPHVDIPGGSFNQEDWFKTRYRRVPYEEAAAKRDSVLRIGFRDKTKAQRVRHVWFIVNGQTIESTKKDGHDGPATLLWDRRKAEASDCFELGRLLPARFDVSWIPGADLNQFG
jgi:hypothetical protein